MGLFPFGHACGLYPVFEPRPRMQTKEIDIVGAQQKSLRHQRVIIFLFRQMAIGASFGLGGRRIIRKKRRESLA